MILLVPIGPIPIHIISWLEDKLGFYVDCPVKTGKAVPLPRQGYDEKRQQYTADAVMELLQGVSCQEAERLVGLIDQDCHSQGLNFIFGFAAVNGRESFVALPRLRPDFYELQENKCLVRQRVLKEVVHELGHTWGLSHCDNEACVMGFSNSVDDTDSKDTAFCQRCFEKKSP